MLCRALFENIAVLNSYFELYSTLVLHNNLNPSYQEESHGKLRKGDLSKSFKKIIASFNDKYRTELNNNTIIYCLLAQRYLDGGKIDLNIYKACDNNWNIVFRNNDELAFKNNDLVLEGITNDISFLSNKFVDAKKWYSIICEFVHPNSGSHRTVIFENSYGMFSNVNNKFIQTNISQDVVRKLDKYRGVHDLKIKYKLCSVSNFETEGNYSFIIESTYVSLVNLLKVAKETMFASSEILQEH